MSNAAVALSWIFGAVALCTLIGLLAGRKQKMNLEQWSVGGRKFGAFFVWLLMGGEIYTTFIFLGVPGWIYSKGAPTFYILAYGTLAYMTAYFLLPAIWRAGKNLKLVSQPDFFYARYDSKLLAAVITIIGVVFMIPYLQLQLIGLGIVVEILSYGAIGRSAAMIISFVLVALFVFISGMRGAAWTSVVKDSMMIISIIVVSIGLPYIYYGGFANVFSQVAAQFPKYLTLPGNTSTMNVRWFISTLILTACGFYMWPQFFGSVYSAKSGDSLKINSIFLPLYQLGNFLFIVVGFVCLLTVPGLANGDLAFLTLVKQTYPAWFVGFIGATGAVTAMVPSSVIIISASTLIAKNVYQDMFQPHASEKSVTLLARCVVVVITITALALAIYAPQMLVNLLLMGYNGVSQFFPAVVLALFWRRATKTGVLTGLVVGIGMVAVLTLNKLDPFMGFNAGCVALVVNFIVTVLVSLVTSPPSAAVTDRFFKAIAE